MINVTNFKTMEKRTKMMEKRYKMMIATEEKARKKLVNELADQLDIVTSCAGIALYENWGWREKRIAGLYKEFNAVWDENAADKKRSIVEVCSEETGIDVFIPGFSGNYDDLKFFRGYDTGRMTIEQEIVMRNKQCHWAPAMMLATAIVALHRRYGFGYERLARLNEQIVEVRQRYKGNVKKIKQACLDITGVVFTIEEETEENAVNE